MIPAILSGIFFSLTGWVPYTPEVKSLIFDFHNFSIISTALFYLILVFALAHQKKDQHIATVSGWASIGLSVAMVANIAARVMGKPILFEQILLLASCQIWIVAVNLYVVKDEPWAKQKIAQTT